MAPLRGWGPRGRRVRGYAPHGHWRTLTFVGALRYDWLTAPCVFNGPINGPSFGARVEQLLVRVNAEVEGVPRAGSVTTRGKGFG